MIFEIMEVFRWSFRILSRVGDKCVIPAKELLSMS